MDMFPQVIRELYTTVRDGTRRLVPTEARLFLTISLHAAPQYRPLLNRSRILALDDLGSVGRYNDMRYHYEPHEGHDFMRLI